MFTKDSYTAQHLFSIAVKLDHSDTASIVTAFRVIALLLISFQIILLIVVRTKAILFIKVTATLQSRKKEWEGVKKSIKFGQEEKALRSSFP